MPRLFIILVPHDAVFPQPVNIPGHVAHDVVRQKDELQPQNVKHAWLLIAAAAKPHNMSQILNYLNSVYLNAVAERLKEIQ